MPAWFYGPGGEARIFADGEAMPEGWADSPAAFANDAPELADAPASDPVKRGPGRPRKVA